MPDINVEERVLSYIDERGIKYEAICKATGITRNVIQNVRLRGRKLRTDEFAKICAFLREDPNRFLRLEEEDESKNNQS